MKQQSIAVTAEIIEIADMQTRAYNPELCRVAGSLNAGVFLSRVLYWWIRKGRANFWKMNTGENSWVEQDGFTLSELRSGRSAVSTRVKKPQVREKSQITPDMLEIQPITRTRRGKTEVIGHEFAGIKRCVLYWQNGGGKMWYKLNQPLLIAILLKQQNPKRDNVDILKQIQLHYPDAPISLGNDARVLAFPEPPPAPPLSEEITFATLPEPEYVPSAGWLDNYYSVIQQSATLQLLSKLEETEEPVVTDETPQSPQGDTQKWDKDTQNRYQEATAYAFNTNPGGFVGRMVNFFTGRYPAPKNPKKPTEGWIHQLTEEKRDEDLYPATPEEIAGFKIWYTYHNPDFKTLPKTLELVAQRIQEFRSAPDRERFMKLGTTKLHKLMGEPEVQPQQEEASPEPEPEKQQLFPPLNLPPMKAYTGDYETILKWVSEDILRIDTEDYHV